MNYYDDTGRMVRTVHPDGSESFFVYKENATIYCKEIHRKILIENNVPIGFHYTEIFPSGNIQEYITNSDDKVIWEKDVDGYQYWDDETGNLSGDYHESRYA